MRLPPLLTCFSRRSSISAYRLLSLWTSVYLRYNLVSYRPNLVPLSIQNRPMVVHENRGCSNASLPPLLTCCSPFRSSISASCRLSLRTRENLRHNLVTDRPNLVHLIHGVRPPFSLGYGDRKNSCPDACSNECFA